MKNYKILFADLDGTLIKTKSGEIFPKGIWDMEFRFDVLDAIKEMNPLAILIVSNQEGIEKGFVNMSDFEFKVDYICSAVKEYTKTFTDYYYCASSDNNDNYRKPNTGMLASLFYEVTTRWFKLEKIGKKDCLMIGDASGKEGQFSDTDKKSAENFGIDYMDVDDFIRYFED